MTGFANKTISVSTPQGEKTHISLSLKSLNYRFFESTFKIPHQLSSLEIGLIRLCKEAFVRGHIYLTIHISNTNVFRGNIEPALPIIQSYIDAINTIKKIHNISQEITLDTMLRLPNIFNTEEAGIDKQIETTIVETIKELIHTVIITRLAEGEHLKRDLEQRIATMREEIYAIATASHELITTQKDKIAALSQTMCEDEQSLNTMKQEAFYAMLDKMDLNEEIVRFKSHLEVINEELHSNVLEKGKRLDFRLQELGREINTITAKCGNAPISLRAINIKVEVEKAREQIQNIV